MGNPKNQHYNPQLILRNYSNAGRHVWSYCKADGLAYRRIDKVFVARHLYTRKSIDNNNKASQSPDPSTFRQSIRRDYGYEMQIGKIETEAAPVVKRIIAQAQLQQCPQLSPEQSAAWKKFAFLTARRTPESQDRARALCGTDDPDLFYNVAKAVASRDSFPLPDKDQLYEDPRVAVLEDLVSSCP